MPARSFAAIVIAVSLLAAGCRSSKPSIDFDATPPIADRAASGVQLAVAESDEPAEVTQAAAELTPGASESSGGEPEATVPGNDAAEPPTQPQPVTEVVPAEPADPRATGDAAKLRLVDVVQSVRANFPLIRSAIAARTIASGEALAAAGAWDHKLEGFSQSQPLDFYENYRHSIGVKRDTYNGGQVFAGYRNGRGVYEPWYLERETNKGGEFKVGFVTPFARDRWIDPNRAEYWRSLLEQRRVEPEIQAAVIAFVRDGSIAYWEWVAAGEAYLVAYDILRLGVVRNRLVRLQVKEQEKAAIDLRDNERIVFERQAKLVDARRKLEQTAAKLALFWRDGGGAPLLAPWVTRPNGLPRPVPLAADAIAIDEGIAVNNRPELSELSLIRRQLAILHREARNQTLPEIDGGILVGQDVGEPTSSKRDKSELELEATMTLSVPLQRRKALGKMRQLRGKLAEVRQKTRFQREKIIAEVRVARAGVIAAAERAEQNRLSLEQAKEVLRIERVRFDEGDIELFQLNAREKQVADAALAEVGARFDYHAARADYLAALGVSDGSTLAPADAEEKEEGLDGAPRPEPLPPGIEDAAAEGLPVGELPPELEAL
ncbi:MAG: TolC family protein [Planctomycetota bacterium]